VRLSRFEQVRANIRRVYQAGREPAPADGDSPPLVEEIAPTNGSHPSTVSQDDTEVPHGLRIAAAWAWRLLVIGALAVAIVYIIGRIRIVIVPLVIALLLSALLSPVTNWLLRHRVPRSLAAGLTLVGGLVAVAGTLTLVINQFIDGVPDLPRTPVRASTRSRTG
jgi:hypothetical protein